MSTHTFDKRNQYYFFGGATIREGEACAVVKKDGNREIYEGPHFVRPMFGTLEMMRRYTVGDGEYLKIKYLNGATDISRGPATAFFDTSKHHSIEVEEALRLESNEAMVTYTEEGSNVSRNVIYGPEVVVPAVNQWIHNFSWHGTMVSGKGSKTGFPGDTKTAHACEFWKLRVLPDHIYITVRDVRTADKAKITVHLMVFYELTDIEQMLDNTNDPIADMINSTSADVMKFASENSHESFLEQAPLHLNKEDAYPLLRARLKHIGYNLVKVVYRGFDTNDALQRMHDKFITSQTQLRLDADVTRETQIKLALELDEQDKRQGQEQKIKTQNVEHEMELSGARHKETLLQKQQEHEQKLKFERERHNLKQESLQQEELLQKEADKREVQKIKWLEEIKTKHEQERLKIELDSKKAAMEEKAKFLTMCKKELGVDVGALLVAEAKAHLKPTDHILIESTDGSPSNPHVHLNRDK